MRLCHCDVVDEVWYNDLKDASTFYMQVTALEIMAFLSPAITAGLTDIVAARST
jgi:hypothetical protein